MSEGRYAGENQEIDRVNKGSGSSGFVLFEFGLCGQPGWNFQT